MILFSQISLDSAASARNAKRAGRSDVHRHVSVYRFGGCALLGGAEAGYVKCWGRNNAGQISDGAGASRAAPVYAINTPASLTGLASGYDTNCFINSSGAMLCTGTTNGAGIPTTPAP